MEYTSNIMEYTTSNRMEYTTSNRMEHTTSNRMEYTTSNRMEYTTSTLVTAPVEDSAVILERYHGNRNVLFFIGA